MSFWTLPPPHPRHGVIRVTSKVHAVNVDAALTCILMGIAWPLLIDKKITVERAIDLPFLAFALGRVAGGAGEYLDHRESGTDMDMRIPVSNASSWTHSGLTFVVTVAYPLSLSETDEYQPTWQLKQEQPIGPRGDQATRSEEKQLGKRPSHRMRSMRTAHYHERRENHRESSTRACLRQSARHCLPYWLF